MLKTDISLIKRWNIFARELEDVLANRGLRLSQLDDHAFIHREKVRRLRASLLRPKSFPVLNPGEMDEVITALGLDRSEILRLQVALFATAIEEMLMERTTADNALQMAEQCFPVLFRMLEKEHPLEVRHTQKPPFEYMRWNIFARELEDILANHGLRLGQLDDRTSIHREKIHRLQKSLLRPKSFPVLNPIEMSEVIATLDLDRSEILRLQAALFATAIEEMLMERTTADNALQMAEQCFCTLFDALLTFEKGETAYLAKTSLNITRSYECETERIQFSTSHTDSSNTREITLELHSKQEVDYQTPSFAADVSATIDSWLVEIKSTTHSWRTLATYSNTIQQLRMYLQSIDLDLNSNPFTLTRSIQKWASTRSPHITQKPPVSQATYKHRLSIVSSFYRYVRIQQINLGTVSFNNPVDNIPRTTLQSFEYIPLPNQAIITKRLAYIDRSTNQGKRDYALLWVLLTINYQASEIAQLRISHVEWSDHRITIIWVDAEGTKQPATELTPAAAKALKEYLYSIYGNASFDILDDMPLWVSFSQRNSYQAISTQTIADICLKHLGVSTVNAARYSVFSEGT